MSKTTGSIAKLVDRLKVISIILLTVILMLPAKNSQAQSDNTNLSTGIKTEDTSSAISPDDLSSNECLKQLDDYDEVIASIAFKDGVAGFTQLEELVKRKPWGSITDVTKTEIEQQLEAQSPFLIITLTKQQALTLDNHRDIILWILVQSTTKPCT